MPTPENQLTFCLIMALELYRRAAADQGDVYAQTCLGNCYFDGDDGVEQCYERAVKVVSPCCRSRRRHSTIESWKLLSLRSSSSSLHRST
mmetsp:Transcript_1861/g.2473  ORF Transcript_1861/g.2473 Transcript_1861/m.2473 type:complete len:90 (-) Transcript_1861:494-763(-)